MNTFHVRALSLFPSRRELGAWSLTFISYLLTSQLGLFLYRDIGTAPSFIWPAAGVALAFTFLYGYRMWSAIALAAIVVNVSREYTPVVVLASTLGNTVQALVGAYLFHRFNFRPLISRLSDTLKLMLVSLTVTAIGPTLSLIVRAIGGDVPANAADIWRSIWSGGVLSVLILTPLIISYAQEFTFKRERVIEHTVALVFLCTVVYALFWTSFGMVAGIPLVYILLFPFFWIALRFHPRSTVLALFLAALIAISGAVFHPPTGLQLGQWLFQTQLLLEIFATIFLILASVIEDRRLVTRALNEHVHQLETAITRIREQDTAKSDFLATLAHELRNPLAPVLSTLELLRLRRGTGEEATLIAGAEQRLHMMGRLLDDLLDIARISEKRLTLKKEFVQLNEIILRSIDGARPLIEKYGHDLDLSLPPESPALFADPVRIEQVLVNVLNNAAKYTEPGGRIALSARTKDSRVRISVTDSGTGIEPKMLNRIFEPFLQISQSKYGTSGVGIGLALAKELVEMHDGAIVAKSDGLGHGSTFDIDLPVTHAMPAAAPVASTVSPLRPLTILIVDDNQAGTEALGRLLSFRGHKTLLAFGGVSGVVSALAHSPDCVLLDIGLPDIDGYEAARRLREKGYTGCIIALTGYGQEADRLKAIEAGCDAHLTKPVGLKEIEAVLSERF